jgi:hypothetical protein
MAADSASAHTARRATSSVDIEVVVDARWDAVSLCNLLVPFHSYLVQYTPERWVVRGRAPGCHGESLDVALGAITRWRTTRGVEAAVNVAPRGGDAAR